MGTKHTLLSYKIFFLFLFFLPILDGKSQNGSRLFGELDVNHTFRDDEQWNMAYGGLWKHSLNDDPGWSRIGGNINANRKFNQWHIGVGGAAKYQYDQDLTNFVELRPWIELALKNDVIKNVKLAQRLRSEFRTFYYSDGSNPEGYARLRYKLDLSYKYVLHKNNSDWRVNSYVEFYYLKDPAYGERYVDSNEVGLYLTREFKDGKSLGLGYTYERLNPSIYSEIKNGDNFIINYSF